MSALMADKFYEGKNTKFTFAGLLNIRCVPLVDVGVGFTQP